MSALWTPPTQTNPRARPSVSKEHQTLVRQWEQSVLSMMYQSGGIIDYWNPELEKIDKNLRLMHAMEAAVAPGVKAGYYHLVRLRDPVEGTFMMVQPLQGPNEEFVEPTSQMLDMLRWADLQSDRVIRERQANDRKAAEAAEREKQREHEDRVDQGVGVFKAITGVQVLTSADVPYANKVAGAKKPTAGKGK